MLIKKFYSICTTSHFIMHTALKWWVMWSNFYQSMEKIFLKTRVVPLYSKMSEEIDAITAWERFIKNNEIYWTADTWYMLFDVMSLPERVFYRKKDDCDGFAILAHAFFGGGFYFQNYHYVFSHIEIQIAKETAHAICVYRAESGHTFIITNGHAHNTYQMLTGTRHIAEIVFDKNKLVMRDFRTLTNQL